MADPTWVDGTTPLNSVNMTKLQTRDEKGAASGYAALDGTGKVPAAQLPPAASPIPPVVNGQWIKGVGGAAVWSSITPADVAGVESQINKGAANGYASLDATSKVPASQLPAIGGGFTVGSAFPASPAVGQGFVFESAKEFMPFIWDGTHWYSRAIPAICSMVNQTTDAADNPVVLVDGGPITMGDLAAQGVGAQLRIEGFLSNGYTGTPGDGSKAGHYQAGFRMAGISGNISPYTWLAATDVATPSPNNQIYVLLSSGWVDSGAIYDAIFPCAGGYRGGGGAGFPVNYVSVTVWVRFKK